MLPSSRGHLNHGRHHLASRSGERSRVPHNNVTNRQAQSHLGNCTRWTPWALLGAGLAIPGTPGSPGAWRLLSTPLRVLRTESLTNSKHKHAWLPPPPSPPQSIYRNQPTNYTLSTFPSSTSPHNIPSSPPSPLLPPSPFFLSVSLLPSLLLPLPLPCSVVL